VPLCLSASSEFMFVDGGRESSFKDDIIGNSFIYQSCYPSLMLPETRRYGFLLLFVADTG
jgi:hypothetical protein